MIDYKTILFLALPVFIQAEFMILDQGHTIVSGPVGDTMITHCDIFEKTSLEGKLIPLEQQINMEIIRQEVIADKMPLDDTAADKYIANIQKMHNLTTEDMEDLALQCNRTLPEVKQLLNAQYTYDFFLYHKFRAHLVPTDQAVEEYCKEHPEIEPGYCVIQVAFADYAKDTKQRIRDTIDEIVSGKIEDTSVITWSDPIRVDINNLAEDKLFIKDLAVGQITVLDEKSAFELYKLIEKSEEKLVPIESRKAMVIDLLNRQMYEDLLTNYEQHMRDHVAIINLVPMTVDGE